MRQAGGGTDVVSPQVIRFLQFTQVSDFGIQVFLRFRLTATAGETTSGWRAATSGLTLIIRNILSTASQGHKDLCVHPLHDCSVTTLVRMVLQCQAAVFLLQIRHAVYVLKKYLDSEIRYLRELQEADDLRGDDIGMACSNLGLDLALPSDCNRMSYLSVQ